jgi:hypothetical protein
LYSLPFLLHWIIEFGDYFILFCKIEFAILQRSSNRFAVAIEVIQLC